jgi:outer membrane protein TolC
VLTALLLGVTTGVAAQSPLTLAEALSRAEAGAYANRAAAGETATRDAVAMQPYRGILPSFRFESGYIRTTDPLNAFGFTLRQREVSLASFSPSSLNDPEPIGNLMTGLVLEAPLLNFDAWYGRSAASRATDASRAAEDWTRRGTAIQVVKAYYGAVLAVEQVRTLESALSAAESHRRQADAMVREGLATRSDGLLAAVKAGEVEVKLLEARSQARIARRGLAVVMGDPADTLFSLPDSLPSAESLHTLASVPAPDTAALAGRADVQAARFAQSAADADARRARSLYLPRLNGFGRLDWNDPNSPFGGDNSWTVGVMLSWSPFAGASEIGEGKAAAGRQASARAMAEAASAQAALELTRANEALQVALARLEIAARGADQSAEAHRIVARKYEGGLASITELFDAAAIETGSRLAHAAARFDALVAAAESRRAAGQDLGPIAAIM